MRKSLTILLFLFSLLVCLSFSSDVATQTSSKDEGVEDVILDKSEAILACPGVKRKNFGSCSEENRMLKVSTVSKEAEKNGWTYYYLITGGKIIGEGSNVIWDLTDAKPGTYSITVGVGKEGAIKGNTIIKKIPAYLCECYPVCECPTSASVSASAKSAKRGDAVIFTAQVAGGDQKNVTYNWIISSGTIVIGQGTSQILVRTGKDKGNILTTTVEMGGFCSECPSKSASASVELTDN